VYVCVCVRVFVCVHESNGSYTTPPAFHQHLPLLQSLLYTIYESSRMQYTFVTVRYTFLMYTWDRRYGTRFVPTSSWQGGAAPLHP
jgi:hypothetical protein